MYNKTLVLDILRHIDDILCTLTEGTKDILKLDVLPETADGMLQLNGICMCLLVIGEELKKIDKQTDKQLLSHYPLIPWQDVIGMRDIIAHHYFEIDVDIVSDILCNDIPPLVITVKQMITDLQSE